MKRISIALIVFWLLGLNQVNPETNTLPTGFIIYTIRKDDTLSKIAPSEGWQLIRKVNRVDEYHLIPGKKILIPENLEEAKKFCPVPQSIADELERKIIFFLDIQYFGAYEKGKLSFWGPISSGRKNHETPEGEFYVLWKEKNYWSKKYKVPMRYSVCFSSEGYFFHKQALPGKPASRGCVRLLAEDAEKLFDFSKKGDPVTLTNEKEGFPKAVKGRQ